MQSSHMEPESQRIAAAVGRGAAATRLHFAVWIGCALLLLFAALTVCMRRPWDPDELRYAQITTAMKEDGTLFKPRLWGEEYLEKPPIFFWFVMAFGFVLGDVGLAALVAPAVISACVGLWLAAWIGLRWWGDRAAMFVAGVLVTLPLYLLCTTLGRMDMPFAVAITFATWWFYRGYVEGRRWSKLSAFAAVGVAIVIKGPLGVLFPLGTLVAFLALTGRLRRLMVWETLAGFALSLAVLGVWLVPAMIELGPGYLTRLIVRHVVVAAVDGKDHPKSMFFYMPAVPLLWLPWTVFAPAALWAAWQRWRSERSERDLWLLCWIVVPLVLLTVVRQKMYIYLLPTMLPFAVLMGRYWFCLTAAPDGAGQLRWPAAALRLGGVLGGVLFAAGGWLVQTETVAVLRGELDPILTSLTAPHVLFVAGGVLLAMSLVGWIRSNRAAPRDVRFTFGGVMAASIGSFLVLYLVVYPALDDCQSWWPVARAIQARQNPGEPIVAYQLNPYVGYYFHEPVVACKKPAALCRLLADHESVLCVVPSDKLVEVAECAVATFDRKVRPPSPKGPVYIVRLRRPEADHESDEPARIARGAAREESKSHP